MKKLFLLPAIIIILDQITKLLSIGKSIKISSFLSFNYTKNTGAAFGILEDQNFLLSVISIIVIIVIIYYWKKSSYGEKFGLGLIMAGVIGNLIDRIINGFVIDFIDFGFWPAFNLADASIVLGVIYLLYLSMETKIFKLKKK